MIEPSVSNSVNCNNHLSNDSHKRKQIQQHLVLIFHACRCQKQFEINRLNPCGDPHCAMMRNVLRHMAECDEDRLCTFTHCSTSKRILSHWKKCGQLSCLICAPIKHCHSDRIENCNSSDVNFETCHKRLFAETEKKCNSSKFESSVTLSDIKSESKHVDIRKSVIKEIMTTILPLKNYDKAYQDPRMDKVIELVKEYEMKIFRNAKSLDDYYQTSAKYCFAMQKRLNITPKTNEDKFSSNIYLENSSKYVGSDTNGSISSDIYNKSACETDYLNQCKNLLQSEYERQTQVVECQEGKSNNFENPIKIDNTDKSLEQNFKNEIFVEDKPTIKFWSYKEIKQSFNDLIEYIKNNKHISQFLSQIDSKCINTDNLKNTIRCVTLNTVLKKFEECNYTEPWELTDDVNYLIKNALIASKKNRKMKKDNLLQICGDLQAKLDNIMISLKFCCGRDEVYQPLILLCSTSNACNINKDAVYYSYQNDISDNSMTDTYVCCEKCYADNLNDITFLTESGELFTVKKELLIKKKNNLEIPEEFVFCSTCKRKWHKVCACFSEEIWTNFICKYCIEKLSVKRENRFTAKKLPTCILSKFLERRVNDYLKKNEIQCENVTIRVLSNVKKEIELKRRMKMFHPECNSTFPYKSKAIFAFQEYEGKEICFFGLHVQEYGSDCPEPNTRRVYIAYLDSVRFFEPAKQRTKVYYEILVGYLDYVKKLGYVWAHIWACPPSEGDDYIFNIHPPDQKVPKPKRLQDWYCKMLDKGIQELVVNDYKDIFKDITINDIKSSLEIPYFEGDFWPNAFEEFLKEFEEMSLKNKNVSDEIDDNDSIDGSESINEFGSKKPKKRKQKKTTNLTSSKRRKCYEPVDIPSEFLKKVLENVEKLKDNFFTIRLHPENNIPSLKKTIDQDPIIESELMDGRDNFLQMARTKHLEFSSLRRTLYSTLVMCYELHTEAKQNICYTCNVCNEQIEVRYHCNVCYEYDLCEKCYETEKHEHDLHIIRSSHDNYGDGSDIKSDTKYEESSRARVDKLVKIFVHSSSCRDVNCRISNCQQMKGMLYHCKSCKNRLNCNICKKVYTLSNLHAKYCTDANCNIPYCQQNKETLRRNDNKQRLRQKQLIRRRTEIMRFNSKATNMSNSTSISDNNGNISNTIVQSHMSSNSLHSTVNNIDNSNLKVTNAETFSRNNYGLPKHNHSMNDIPQSMPCNYNNGVYQTMSKPFPMPSKSEIDMVENIYKSYINSPNGHSKFLDFIKSNPHFQHAAQFINQRQMSKSISQNTMYQSNVPQNIIPPAYSPRIQGHMSPYISNSIHQSMSMNGYVNQPKLNINIPVNMNPNSGMNMNRFPQINDGYSYNLNNFITPNQIRIPPNYPMSNGMINQSNQIYPKMSNNQKPNGQNQINIQQSQIDSIYRTNPNYY